MPDNTAFVIACTGLDEPGLLAGICDAIDNVNGSLADSRMHRLGGIFSGIIVISVPATVTRDEVDEALNTARTGHTRVVVQPVHPTAEVSSHPGDTTSWIVSSAGADQPGILKALTHVVADAGCEFADVSTHVRHEDGEDTFVLVCEVDAPSTLTRQDVEAIVDPAGAPLGIDFVVIPADPEEMMQ